MVTLVGVVIAVAVSSTSTASSLPYPAVDLARIAVVVTPSPEPISAAPLAQFGGPYRVASRTQFGICISDRTGTLSADQKQDQLLAALAEVEAAYPEWAARRLTPAPLLLGLECPLDSPILRPGIDRSNIGVAGESGPSDRISPFRLFVFIVSPETIQSLFVWPSITTHVAGQEAMCEPGRHVCETVSKGLYVTPEEYADKDRLSRGLIRALGLEPPPSPGLLPLATPTSSPSPEPQPAP
ncbi:MAG: hypothetical protein IT306_18460 [Chloroflexi bacterium]|nr:hypothetical protein [Chloroflexota bacterium]